MIVVLTSFIFFSVFIIPGVIIFSFYTVNKPAKIIPKNVNQFLGLPTAIVEDIVGDQPATKHGYIVKTTPDQENSLTPQVQIRGLVSKWTTGKLLLQVNNEFDKLAVVKDKIPAGSPVGVIANSMARGLWMAIKVLGFGCNT